MARVAIGAYFVVVNWTIAVTIFNDISEVVNVSDPGDDLMRW
ncbi:hypothetical protein [Clostridium sp. FP1]|nr:hypothetical protein [Clostridium sp. FP1]